VTVTLSFAFFKSRSTSERDFSWAEMTKWLLFELAKFAKLYGQPIAWFLE
jgi:hypothetical protein